MRIRSNLQCIIQKIITETKALKRCLNDWNPFTTFIMLKTATQWISKTYNLFFNKVNFKFRTTVSISVPDSLWTKFYRTGFMTYLTTFMSLVLNLFWISFVLASLTHMASFSHSSYHLDCDLFTFWTFLTFLIFLYLFSLIFYFITFYLF